MSSHSGVAAGVCGFGLSSLLLLSYNYTKRQTSREKVQSALDTVRDHLPLFYFILDIMLKIMLTMFFILVLTPFIGYLMLYMKQWYAGGALPCAQMLVMRDNKELFYGTSGFANEQKEELTREVSKVYCVMCKLTLSSGFLIITRIRFILLSLYLF